jgi:hypothetical protein
MIIHLKKKRTAAKEFVLFHQHNLPANTDLRNENKI